jgi:hypothetical protein
MPDDLLCWTFVLINPILWLSARPVSLKSATKWKKWWHSRVSSHIPKATSNKQTPSLCSQQNARQFLQLENSTVYGGCISYTNMHVLYNFITANIIARIRLLNCSICIAPDIVPQYSRGTPWWIISCMQEASTGSGTSEFWNLRLSTYRYVSFDMCDPRPPPTN